MRTNSTTDEGLVDHPAADIDAVVVDPDDVIETFERDHEDESRLNTHVLRLVPPFDGEVRAEPYLEDGPKRYPPDRDPEPLHLPAGTFVENDEGPHPGETHLTIPTTADAREAATAEHDDPDDGTVETYHKRLFEGWEANVRDALVDRIRIHWDPANGDEIWTDARYEKR